MFPKKYIFIIIFIFAILLCGKEAHAATEFVSTIRATGGNYSLLSTWEAAVQSNLTASTTVVYSGTGTGGISAGATLELFRAGVYQNITALKVATTSDQLLVQSFSGGYKVLQNGDQWRKASSTDNMWTVSIAGLGDSAIAVAECYNDWPTGLVESGGSITIDGWTTNTTNYIKIYAPEGERHNGTVKSGGVYTGFAFNVNATPVGFFFWVYETYTVIDGIIFDATGTYNNGINLKYADSNYSKIKNCIFQNFGTPSVYAGIKSDDYKIHYIYNNIFIKSVVSVSATKASTNYVYLYNNTFYGGRIEAGDDGVTRAKNNIVYFTAGNSFYSATGYDTANCGYNISDDATAPGVGSLTNKTLANIAFVSTTAGSENLHLKNSSVAVNKGVDLSADASYPITDDIDYQTRPYGTAWDIGADELEYYSTQINSPQTNVLTSGLVGYWSFNGQDMGTTSAADLSGSSNTGWLMNGVKKVPGISGQGMSFDGTDDYVEIPKNTSIGSLTNNFTVSTWVKANSFTNPTILTSRRSSSNNGIALKLAGANITFTTLNVKDYVYTITSSANAWYHILVVLDSGDDANFYVNGAYKGVVTHTSPAVANTDDPLYIGRNDSTNYFNGLIDEVRIYNRALSENEIGQLYRSGARKMKIDPMKGYKTIIR